MRNTIKRVKSDNLLMICKKCAEIERELIKKKAELNDLCSKIGIKPFEV